MQIDPLRLIRMLAGIVMVWVVMIVTLAFIMFFKGAADIMSTL